MLNLSRKLLIFVFSVITSRKKSFCDLMFYRVLIYFYTYSSLIVNNSRDAANTCGL